MDDPYLSGDSIIVKPPVIARLCSVHGTKRSNRGITPILQRTRAVSTGEVHELILFDTASGDGIINDTGYIGFAEILCSGILKVGDCVLVNGTRVGTVHGFDETHMPNHQNILIRTETLCTGLEFGCQFGDAVVFISTQ